MIRHLCPKKLLPWYLGLLFLNKIIYEHVKISKKEHLFKRTLFTSCKCEKKLEMLGNVEDVGEKVGDIGRPHVHLLVTTIL